MLLIAVNKLSLWISTQHPTKYEQIQAFPTIALIKMRVLSEIKFLIQPPVDLLKLLHNFTSAAS